MNINNKINKPERTIRQYKKVLKGNVYKNLDPEVEKWLLDLAEEMNVDNLAIVIASIIKDSFYEEMEEREKNHQAIKRS